MCYRSSFCTPKKPYSVVVIATQSPLALTTEQFGVFPPKFVSFCTLRCYEIQPWLFFLRVSEEGIRNGMGITQSAHLAA